jgi:hypothetical protein
MEKEESGCRGIVVVAIIPGDNTKVPRTDLLKRLFSKSIFRVIEVECGVISNTIEDREKMLITKALNQAHDKYPNRPTIVVKDTSTSTLTPDMMEETVLRCLKGKRFDLCYLCKWEDKCQLYKEPPDCPWKSGLEPQSEDELINTGTGSRKDVIAHCVGTVYPGESKWANPWLGISIVQTKAPQGIQAILFSTKGMDIILGKSKMCNGRTFTYRQGSLSDTLRGEIFAGNIAAITTVPNVIDYDIILNATSTNDFSKVNECLPVVMPPSASSGGGSNVLGFFVVIFFILLIGWAALRLGPRK